MGYYASCSGNIRIRHPFTKEEVTEITDLFKECFNTDVYEYKGHGMADLYHAPEKYHEEDVDDVLNAFSDKFKDDILSAELRYIGEDNAHWRLLWKDGKWIEQNGEIVYRDDDVFYTDTWSVQDVLTALDEQFPEIPPTTGFVQDVIRRCKADRRFMETVSAAGWLALFDKIRETVREGEQICQQKNS